MQKEKEREKRKEIRKSPTEFIKVNETNSGRVFLVK